MTKPASVRILSDIITYMKYAKYIKEIKRRETWEELVERNMAMHIRQFPQLKFEIQQVYKKFVIPKKVLPSMRSLQFAGRPIEINPTRIYNCAYAPIDHIDMFSEAMFLLLGGTGFGYSVQRHHVAQLPDIKGPIKRTRRYVVGDSIEGWADAVKVVIEAYFLGKSTPVFDYSDIRPKGALLVTSGDVISQTLDFDGHAINQTGSPSKESWTELYAALENKTVFPARFAKAAPASGDPIFEGDVFCSEINITSDDNDTVKFSGVFTVQNPPMALTSY